MAAENQPNPERFMPDVTLPPSHEQPIVMAELLSRGGLAHEIIEDDFDMYTKEESGQQFRRAQWESDDGVFSFNLFECHNSQGVYYAINVTEIGVSGDKWYEFLGDRMEWYEHNFADKGTKDPDQGTQAHEITDHLRNKYRQTARGKEAERRSAQTFNDIAGVLTVEDALASHDPRAVIARVDAGYDKDDQVREEGIHDLFQLAIASYLSGESVYISNEESFRMALPRALEERYNIASQPMEFTSGLDQREQ